MSRVLTYLLFLSRQRQLFALNHQMKKITINLNQKK